jgi:hypothetical protein
MRAWSAGIWMLAALVVAVPLASQAASSGPAKAAKREHTPHKPNARPKFRTAVDEPMQVHIVRSGVPGCEPNCPEWIAAQGKIEPGTLAKFKTVLKLAGHRNLPVFLHSGGGSVSDAMAIGRLLRAKGLDAVVTATLFTPCAPSDTACRKQKQPDGVLRGLPYPIAVCASSCTFLLAGGKRRFVGPVAVVGVHQIKTLQTYRQVRRVYQMTRQPDGRVAKTLLSEQTLTQKTVETKTGKDMYDRLARFFAEMGIGQEIVAMFQSTPNASVRWLTRDELKATGLATDAKDGLLLNAEAPASNGTTASVAPTSNPPSAPNSLPSSGECAKFGGAALGCHPVQ